MQTKVPPSDLADKFLLRLPDGMRAIIAVEARRNGRSMNNEIVALLVERYGDHTVPERSKPRVEALMEEQTDLLTQILAALKG